MTSQEPDQAGQQGGPADSGQIPPLAPASIPRSAAGLRLAVESPGTTVVLVPQEGMSVSGPAGLGGTGKTQLAAILAHALRRDHGVTFVLWVTAASREAVVSGYAQALRDAGVPGPVRDPEQAAAQFLVWLARTDRPWVVVLDDLSDGTILRGLWPRGPAGRVLVTTEYPDSASEASNPHLVPVGPFSPREALAYLSAELQDKSHLIGGLDLADDLGFLPLALAQAVAVMTSLGIGCRDYRARLAEYRARLNYRESDRQLPALAAAWLLSAEAADLMMPAGLCSRTLTLACVMAPHGIPGVALTSDAACEYLTGQPGGSAGQRAQAGAIVHSLARAGLLAVNPASAACTVLVHPLVQAIARQQLSEPERRQAVLAAAAALVQVWSRPELPPAVAQRLRACAASLHELAGPLLWTPDCHPLLLQAGNSLESSGMTGLAADYWQDMLAASRRVLGSGHERTIMIRDRFASACEASGRLNDAVAVYERVVAEQERTQYISHADAGAARASLARAYGAVGRYGDAIRLAQEALADLAEEPGSRDNALVVHEYLARAYYGAGYLDQAIGAFREILAARERILGLDHPQTIASCGELAGACRAAGRFKEAIDLGRRALADFERARGTDHADTLAARAALAGIYRAAKKHKRALPLYERTLADRERLQGPDHPDVISAGADLAAAYQAAGQLASAVSQYRQTLAACERAYGPDHQRTRAARSDLSAAAAHARAVLGIDLRAAAPR